MAKKRGRPKGRGIGPNRRAKKDAKQVLEELRAVLVLDQAEVKRLIGLGPEDVEMLRRLSRGYVRGSMTILSALKERMAYTLSKPRVDIGHGGIPPSEGGEPIEFTATFADGVPLPGLDGVPPVEDKK